MFRLGRNRHVLLFLHLAPAFAKSLRRVEGELVYLLTPNLAEIPSYQ
jgi:hypothetical protein